MLSHIVRRVLQSFGVLAVMSLLVFAAVYAVGNPMDILVNPQSDQDEIARATARWASTGRSSSSTSSSSSTPQPETSEDPSPSTCRRSA